MRLSHFRNNVTMPCRRSSAVFMIRIVDQMSIEETASLLGIPPATVKIADLGGLYHRRFVERPAVGQLR